jgi:DNA-binding NarL/FixJ family response regulator
VQHRILLVEDHPTFRIGLRWVLESLPGCAAPVEAASQAQAMERLGGAERFHLVIYDWRLPDGGGVRGLLATMQLAPDVPVLVISSDADEAIGLAARQLGAAGCLCKSAAPETIRRCVAGLLDLAEAAGPAEPAAHAPVRPVPATLTSRQAEVLRHLAAGASNKEISRRLGISSLTVRTHVARIMAALNAHNRTQAVVAAAGLGLVDGLGEAGR